MSQQKPDFKSQYDNFIGGQWVAPVDGEYFENTSPVEREARQTNLSSKWRML